MAEVLHERVGAKAVLLHDRGARGTRGNIDHLAIASSGVWVIDAKRYSGKVERRDVGGLFRTDVRLYVGGRDRTKLVHGLAWQLEAVRGAIDDVAVPVHSVLCFVDADWPLLFRKPVRFGEAWVTWPAKLADQLNVDGPLQPADIERVAKFLAGVFPHIADNRARDRPWG